MKIPGKIPQLPGVYIFLNQDKSPIYIGKAKDLKKRVESHFRSDAPIKSQIVVRNAVSIEFIITENEEEALLLEDTLIKKYIPRYNIRLKDDKKYPYIKVTINEDYPRVFYTRKVVKDGSIYFGPYTNVKSIKKSLLILNRIFPLRRCRTKKLPDKVCLDYYIGRCLGPCENKITKEEYKNLVEGAIEFLKGDIDKVQTKVEKIMWAYAEKEDFENAARMRNQLMAIREITKKQTMVTDLKEDIDIIGLYRELSSICIFIFQLRNGRIIGKAHYFIESSKGDSEREIIRYALLKLYNDIFFKPQKIVVPIMPYDRTLLEKVLGTKIVTSKGGKLNRIVKLAEKNAYVEFESKKIEIKRSVPYFLKELQKLVHLKKPPRRIEGFDISDLFGKDAVGSCVVFINGKPKKSEYRRFKIKSVTGINDFAMIAEVVSRRINVLIREEKEFPDLILLDGGKGQLNTVLNIMKEINVGIPVLGLAKRLEEIYLPDGRVVSLPGNSSVLKLLQRIRDEAHRFAISFHKKLRSKKLTKSKLDKIQGIGEKRKQSLILFFGSEKKVEEASIEELMRVKGIGKNVAKVIYEKFHKLY